MISNLSATSKIKVSNLDLDKNDTYFKLEDLEITPSGVEQKFKSNKYGYDNVTVEALKVKELNIVPSTETQVNEALYNKVTVVGDSNLVPENIKDNISIFGVNGTAKTTNAKITDASLLFAGNARMDYFNELLSLCENVQDATQMFYMNEITDLDLTSFDTSKVTSMYGMFYGCDNLINLDISNFNTYKVTNMQSMFYSCNKLDSLDLSNFNTSNVTTMFEMFKTCGKLVNLDLSNFNTSNVIDMRGMFYGCSKLISLDLSNFNISKINSMDNLFEGCYDITEIKMGYTAEQSSLKSLYRTFMSCYDLVDLDLGNIDGTNINKLNDAFYNCKSLKNLKFLKNYGKGFTSSTTNGNSKIKITDCINLTHESLMDIINKLYDLNIVYDTANGGTLKQQFLTMGATNLAKLSPEEIAIATNKGWTVS